jgi:hypothetical protein
MHTALSIVDLVYAAVNGFWLYLALQRPDIYPRWYAWFCGLGMAFCLFVAFI